MTHLVNTLQFEVTCPDEGTSFNLRQNFAQTFQPQITEIINEVCSRYVGESESIKIDKLELDMGTFSLNTLGTDFKNVLRSKFEQQLTKELAKITPADRGASRQLSHAELFFYFLLNGTLPWWADESDIDLDGICSEVAGNQLNVLGNFLYQNRQNKKLWQRILWQLSDGSRSLVIGQSPELKNAQILFAKWAADITANTDTGKYQKDLTGTNDTLVKNAPKILAGPGDTKVLEQIFKEHIQRVLKADQVLSQRVLEGFERVSTGTDGEVVTAPDSAGNEQKEAFQPAIEIANTGEKYAVKNAGIVLLAPFLKALFTELGLLDGDNWKNEEDAFRAVHLLKFLSCGQEKMPEYTLVFEKILCGIAIDTPVPLAITLKDKEIEEAEALLKAVIVHWSILKNTPIDGLRETFLRRDGLITKKETGWLLQVEQKTLDVLLEKIPWGYTTVSLAWNSYLVFVEW